MREVLLYNAGSPAASPSAVLLLVVGTIGFLHHFTSLVSIPHHISSYGQCSHHLSQLSLSFYQQLHCIRHLEVAIIFVLVGMWVRHMVLV